jgi:hypothetical protein
LLAPRVVHCLHPGKVVCNIWLCKCSLFCHLICCQLNDKLRFYTVKLLYHSSTVKLYCNVVLVLFIYRVHSEQSGGFCEPILAVEGANPGNPRE